MPSTKFSIYVLQAPTSRLRHPEDAHDGGEQCRTTEEEIDTECGFREENRRSEGYYPIHDLQVRALASFSFSEIQRAKDQISDINSDVLSKGAGKEDARKPTQFALSAKLLAPALVSGLWISET